MTDALKRALELLENVKSYRKVAEDLEVPEQRLHGWRRGSKPSLEDAQKLIDYFKTEAKAQKLDPVTHILIDRLCELLAEKNNTSQALERERITRDVEQLKALSS